MNTLGQFRNLTILCRAFILAILLFSCDQKQELSKIALSGSWSFCLDSLDVGIDEEWHKKNLGDVVRLPGSLNTNGKGRDISLKTNWTGSILDSSYFTKPEYAKYRQPGNIKVPFWLQPEKHYAGAAWYQNTVEIPNYWRGQHVELFLERCHWETRVWVDNQEVGMQNVLGSPHIYDLSGLLTPGTHKITIRVDNRVKDIDVGINSHSITDHTQTNWNGIVGKIFLRRKPNVHIKGTKIYPDISNKSARLSITINNTKLQEDRVEIEVSAKSFNSTQTHEVPPVKKEIEVDTGKTIIEMNLPMGEHPLLWDEFSPNLYDLKVTLKAENETIAEEQHYTFGMREITQEGRKILVNGRQVFLRGTLECAIFPKTGYPPTDEKEWARIFDVIKSYGLNHMRFHSWCPPEAAFAAADKAGIYLQVENSSWANFSTEIGSGAPIDDFIYKETRANLASYGNHPSFCLMAYGNEPAGENHRAFLAKYVNHWKKTDPRRLYTGGAAWPILDVNQFHVHSEPRIQHWGAGLKSIINSQPPQTLFDFSYFIDEHDAPVISHEIGQWCVYPNFKEINKYNGVLKAKNFEIFRESLKQNGMLHLADSFVLASGKLQTLCYKADIEAALRTKGQAGFQLLDLHDFPGQGTALVGVLDAFWEEKGYVTGEEFSRFCNATVPLVRLPKRIYLSDEKLTAGAEVAHFGAGPISDAKSGWKLAGEGGKIIAQGTFPDRTIPIGNGIELGAIEASFNGISHAQKVILTVNVGNFVNAWDLWVYPSELPSATPAQDLRVVQRLEKETIDYLRNGGKVLLTLKEGAVKPEKGGNVAVGFSSIFWNTAWTNGQPPHTLGILCNPDHPALDHFPTECHSNWQWWDAMSHADAIILEDFDPDMKPVVRIIDDWFTNRPLGLIVEVKTGKGKLLMTGIDLLTGNENRPAARQLLYSLKQYMASDKFDPEISAEIATIQGLLK